MLNNSDTFPDVIRIETSAKCNFKCIHCPTGTQPNKRPILSKENFDYIVDKFISSCIIPRVVVLYHGGEPLLNKNLSSYIHKLKQIGVIKTVITTNASLLNEQRAEELILAGLDEIKISFDGESGDENNYIRQNGDFYQNASNVKTLCKLRHTLKRKNPNIIISNIRICDKTTLLKLNKNRQFVFQEVPEYITKYFKEELDEFEFRSFPAMVWPGFEKYGQFEVINFEPVRPKYCGPLFETFTILSNGDIVTCCYDLKAELVLGNIYKENMFNVWNSKKYVSLRTNFKNQLYDKLCTKCSFVTPRYLCKT